MKRIDRIKLIFTRNWNLPGKERLSGWIKPTPQIKSAFNDGIVWLTSEDIAIHTSADNYIEWAVLSGGTYEDEISKLIRISLKPGFTALDIGANIGLQSLRMSQCVGEKGKIFAFEPLFYLQEKFRKNMVLNCVSNVTLFPFALSDSEGSADFETGQNSWNQGMFSLSNHGNGPGKQHVVIKLGDRLPEIESLNNVNLIKIDVEGFEHQVLKGLKETLTKHRPRIIFEYDSNYWARTGQKISDCYNLLHSLNYTLYQIGPAGCEKIKNAESIESGNLFCIVGIE